MKRGGKALKRGRAAGAIIAAAVAALGVAVLLLLPRFRRSAGTDRMAGAERAARESQMTYETAAAPALDVAAPADADAAGSAEDDAPALLLEPAPLDGRSEPVAPPPDPLAKPEKDLPQAERKDVGRVRAEDPVAARLSMVSSPQAAEPKSPSSAALATLPPAAELVDDLRSYLIAQGAQLAGAKATVKLGRGRPVRAALLSIGESGIRAAEKGLEVDVTWDALGEEGVYLLSRAFAAEAPPEVHAAHLLLAIRLGRTGNGGFEDELTALWKKDAARARRVETALERIRRARSVGRADEAHKAGEERRQKMADRTSSQRHAAPVIGYRPLPPGTVRVWDLGEKYDYKHYWPKKQWEDRRNWKLVPYGRAADYEFEGDCMMEGPNFWVSLHRSEHDACFLYNKIDEQSTPGRHNEMYRSYDGPGGLRTYCGSYEYNRIMRNEPRDIIVESRTKVRYREGHPRFPVQITCRYRVRGGRPWLEIEPLKMASEQGTHGESRIHISPASLPDGEVGTTALSPPRGGDFLADSWKHPDGRVFHPPTSRMLLDFIMDDDCIWAWMWKTPGRGRSRSDNCHGGYPAGWQRIGEGSSPQIFTSPFVKYRDEKLVLGIHRIGYWHYQKMDATVEEGKDLRIAWEYVYERQVKGGPFRKGGAWWPMYPGRWRLVSRISGKYYTTPVTIEQGGVGRREIVYTAPASGRLEYVVIYLYDRTRDTPRSIFTPMDIYREAILGKMGGGAP